MRNDMRKENKSKDYIDHLHEVSVERSVSDGPHGEETFLDEFVGSSRVCPSCGYKVRGTYKKWYFNREFYNVSSSQEKKAAVCLRCIRRFENLKDFLRIFYHLNPEDKITFSCPSCSTEEKPIDSVTRKLSMKNWREDAEEGWMCKKCFNSKIASWNVDGINVHNELAVPAVWKIHGHYLRVVRIRAQELIIKGEGLNRNDLIKYPGTGRERIELSVEDLAKRTGISRNNWYHLENGHTKTISRIKLESIKQAFRYFGFEPENLLRNWQE
jgi:hypothetical protein